MKKLSFPNHRGRSRCPLNHNHWDRTYRNRNDQTSSSRNARARSSMTRILKNWNYRNRSNRKTNFFDYPTTTELLEFAVGSTPTQDTEDGNLIFVENDVLLGRYKILEYLGSGVTADTVKALDLANDEIIAVKIVKKGLDYVAEHEIEVLEELTKKDPNRPYSTQMLHWFTYHGHTCIAFELLGPTLYEYLYDLLQNKLPMKHVRRISHQLCDSVEFLHRCHLTHTDLKPENITMANLKTLEIRIIDFNNATFEDEVHDRVITTPIYRAPEVFMELGWSHPSDVWSVGCIIFELYSRSSLFYDGKLHKLEGQERLAIMKKVLGPIPSSLARKTKTKYFSFGRLIWDDNSRLGKYIQRNFRPLMSYMDSDDAVTQSLFHLISRMLVYDPEERITLKEALKHRFFKK